MFLIRLGRRLKRRNDFQKTRKENKRTPVLTLKTAKMDINVGDRVYAKQLHSAQHNFAL